MLTVPSLANSPTALSLPPSVLAVTTSDIVSTRTTPAALAAPLSNQGAADNAQGNTAIPAAIVAEDTAAGTAGAGSASGALANNINASGPSASFLAQLFSQSDEENSATALAATYAHFAPAPEYNTFVGYSFIKYKPSDAGLPPQRSPLPSPVTPSALPVALPVEPAPVVAQNSQDANAAAVSAPSVPAVTQNSQDAATVPVPAPVAAVPTAPPAQDVPVSNNPPSPAVPAPAAPAAVVSANDFQAYSQTESRNQSNLSFSPPQFIVAG